MNLEDFNLIHGYTFWTESYLKLLMEICSIVEKSCWGFEEMMLTNHAHNFIKQLIFWPHYYINTFCWMSLSLSLLTTQLLIYNGQWKVPFGLGRRMHLGLFSCFYPWGASVIRGHRRCCIWEYKCQSLLSIEIWLVTIYLHVPFILTQTIR